uniref:Uncharacterized protein n=1 Tax=Lotharella globosa TaxID=91324 RepID=A0A6V3JRS3_9EUKA|eukprot:CAMPEP_0167823342 /NCGR_PEP_ID=MMETSP0112_2-20121227/8049_1 /TAXON_ID=91324 /ORGANISM="Lotharella globosa, Strain CCCM811" /LENGTH=132 /DNA_ID=CAMNT_0007724911 /DNA_START=65 /DNA_END=463 /DNA_ORIENTATION=-
MSTPVKEKTPVRKPARGRGRQKERPLLTIDTKENGEEKECEILSPTGKPYTPKEKMAAAKIQKVWRTRRRSMVKKLLSPNSVKIRTKNRREHIAPSRALRNSTRQNEFATISIQSLDSIKEAEDDAKQTEES